MAKRTGKDLGFTIGGTAVAVVRDWEFEIEDVDVDSTAAGDATIDRDSLRQDFTVTVNALLQIASPYVFNTSIGSKLAWAAKIIGFASGSEGGSGSDANGIVSGTAKYSRFRLKAAYDGLVELSCTFKSAGTVAAYDTTPAS